MAGPFGLLGGGSSELDIYGDLFTPEQKAALQQRQSGEGLLRLAGAFGQAAQPSRLPSSFMGALGQAAGAMAGHGDEAANTALKGMEVAEKIKQARAERAILAKAAPFVEAITKQLIGAGVPAAQAAQIAPQIATQVAAAGGTQGAPQAPGAPAASPGAPVLPGAPQPPDLANIAGPASWESAGAPQPPGAPAPRDWSTGPPPAPAPVGMGQRGGLPPDARYNSQGQPISPDLTTTFPGQRSGAALPPGIRFPAGPAPGPQTGLLPPPDQVVGPDGLPLQGLGVLPTMAASYGGAPGGMPPFQRASATPTSGATRGAGGPRSQAIDYFTKQGWTSAQAAGIAANLEAESSWRKDVPGDGGQAFGYAQWHPPRQENFKRVFGKDIRNATEQEQLAFVNWELNNTEKAAGDRLRSAASPRDAAAIVSKYYERPADVEGNAARRGALAEQIQSGGDYVIPSGRGVPANMLMRTADTGAAPGGAPATGGGGFLPGTTVTPEALAAVNAMLKMGGMKSDPFGSLLESYYKSPGYIAEAERTRARAGKEVDLEMDPLIVEQRKRAEYKVDMQLKPELDAAVARLQSPILKEREQAKADIDRVTKQLELAGAAALRPNDVTVYGPGGVLTTQKLTDLETAKRQKDRADRIARGDTSMQPGDIVGVPIGAAPAEHQYITTPEGQISAVPVPGTPAAQKAAEAEDKKRQTEQQNLIARDTVVREVDNIGKLMEDAIFPTTGFIGSILQNLGGTSANDIRVARQTLESRLSRDALNAQRAASPTGAAFGNTSDTDIAILRTSLVNLDQSQNKEQLKERLQILKQAYVDAVHGPGMSRLLPETQVLKKPEPPAAREWKSGDIVDYPDGSQRQLKGEEWVITKPPRK